MTYNPVVVSLDILPTANLGGVQRVTLQTKNHKACPPMEIVKFGA